MQSKARYYSAGMTLVELVIVIVIISFGAAASIKAFSVLSGHSADAMIQMRMVSLAQIYSDEIMSRRFDEDTGNGGVPPYNGCRITDDGETRDNYDDVDDYNAITDESPAFADQTLAALYAGYLVSVAVDCDDSVGVKEHGAKRIDITITAVTGQQALFTLYRGNF